MPDTTNQPRPSTRRELLQTSAVLGTIAATELAVAQQAQVAGRDLLRVGLVGCGGRGTGAAAQALKADSNVKLMAMGDVFADRLERSLQTLQRDATLAWNEARFGSWREALPPQRRLG